MFLLQNLARKELRDEDLNSTRITNIIILSTPNIC